MVHTLTTQSSYQKLWSRGMEFHLCRCIFVPFQHQLFGTNRYPIKNALQDLERALHEFARHGKIPCQEFLMQESCQDSCQVLPRSCKLVPVNLTRHGKTNLSWILTGFMPSLAKVMHRWMLFHKSMKTKVYYKVRTQVQCLTCSWLTVPLTLAWM